MRRGTLRQAGNRQRESREPDSTDSDLPALADTPTFAA
jgi:hypothetical protein